MRSREDEEVILREIGNLKKPIHIQLPYRIFFKMDRFMKDNRIDSYSKTIEKLIDIALILDDHKEQIEDHELLKEFESQYKEGGLVDYFQKLSPADFKIINSIIKTEAMSRQKGLERFIGKQQHD